jgi:hypothetical protein
VTSPLDPITIPALAIPTAAKYDCECPDHDLATLRKDLPEVSHVLIVGWRAPEEHAVRLLRGTDQIPALRAHDFITDGSDGVWTRLTPPARPHVLRVLSGRAGGASHAQPLAGFRQLFSREP